MSGSSGIDECGEGKSASRLRHELLEALARERLEAFLPDRADPVEPFLDLDQAVRVELVDPLLALGADRHEPSLAEDPEVLGYRRAADGEPLRDVAGGERPLGE